MEKHYAIKRTGSSNELTHWKYIKRERGKNGKWRYYYDKESLKNDVKDKIGYDEAERAVDAHNKKEETFGKSIEAHNKYMDDMDAYYLNKTISKNELIESDKKKNKADEDYEKAAKEYVEAQSAFMKTPLGKLWKMSKSINIQDAIDFVDKLIDSEKYRKNRKKNGWKTTSDSKVDYKIGEVKIK